MEIDRAVEKFNSISRERLNFRIWPILCTTLYRNPVPAINFGGLFDQIFLWIFLCKFHTWWPSTFSVPWCKKTKVEIDQKLKSREGSCLEPNSSGDEPVISEYLPETWHTSSSYSWLQKLCRRFLYFRRALCCIKFEKTSGFRQDPLRLL